MKIIVTGSTGRVGGGVLSQCLRNPEVTSVIALTRRPLENKDAKLTNIVHKDFNKYDESVLSQLSGAQACIWALGAPMSGPEVHSGYTWAAVNAFKESLLTKLEPGKPFRFIYTSGGLIPALDSPLLFFLGPKRKLRGDVDRALCKLEDELRGRWETVIARPWSVVDSPEKTAFLFKTLDAWIPREELGAAMVDAALHGSKNQILTNAELRARGHEVVITG